MGGLFETWFQEYARAGLGDPPDANIERYRQVRQAFFWGALCWMRAMNGEAQGLGPAGLDRATIDALMFEVIEALRTLSYLGMDEWPEDWRGSA